MRQKIALSTVIVVAMCSIADGLEKDGQAQKESPMAVVEKRMEAVNKHELDAFLNSYAEDVAIYVYPDRSLGKGREHMRKLFAPMFERGDISVKVSRMVASDSFVVVESTTSFGSRKEQSLAVYEIRGGLIQSVRFLRDTLRAKRIE